MKYRIPIEIFDCLCEIADTRTIKYSDWAAKSNIKNTRISEYIRMSKANKGIIELPADLKKRAFTSEVAISLITGLKNTIGAENMRKDLRKCLEKEQNPLTKVILMAIIKEEEKDKKFIKSLTDYGTLLFKANGK